MNKLVTILFTIGLVLVTLLVLVAKPNLHRQIMIVDSNFAFVDEVDDVEKSPKVVQMPQKAEKIEKLKPQAQSKHKPKQTQTKVVEKIKKNVKTPPIKQDSKKGLTEKKEPPVQIPVKTEVIQEKTVPQVAQEKPAEEIEMPVNSIKQLTEQEEIIAWNQWRSDLQNQVMKDTQIAAPLGVEFKFYFTVDKFGNMSNIKVWSTTPSYSDLAVQRIKPVLMSYQGKPILNFPAGTKRVITNVAGGFVMSMSTGYSSPSDYSDYERVIR